MEHLGPQNVANSVWAWATLRYHNVSALSAMAALAVKSGDARGRFKVRHVIRSRAPNAQKGYGFSREHVGAMFWGSGTS